MVLGRPLKKEVWTHHFDRLTMGVDMRVSRPALGLVYENVDMPVFLIVRVEIESSLAEHLMARLGLPPDEATWF